MKILKICLFVVLFAIILAIAGVVIFVLMFDLNRYKNLAETKLTELLNRPVTIEKMETKLALVPTISISGFKILNNAPFQDDNPLVSVQKMDAELELLPILSSRINIHRIDIDEANVNLVKKNQDNNWEIHVASGKEKEQKPVATSDKSGFNPANLNLNRIVIKTLNFNYKDDKTQQAFTANKLEIKTLHIVSGEILYNKQTFTFNLTTASLFDLLSMSKGLPLDLKVQSRIINATLNGKISDLKELSQIQAVITLKTNNLKNTLSFFKIRHAMIPTQNASLSLQMNGDKDKLDIKQANFDINTQKDLILTSQGELTNLLKNPTLTLKTNIQLLDSRTSQLWHVKPMTMAGDIVVTPNSVQTTKTSIDANRSDIKLSAGLAWNKSSYKLQATMTSDFLSLDDFIVKPENDSDDSSSDETTKNTDPLKISVPWHYLDNADIHANIRISHFETPDLLTDYIGLSAQPTLAKRVLQLPFEVKMLDGSLAGTLTADASKKSVATNMKASKLNLNGIRPVYQEVQNLVLNAQISGQGKGNTYYDILHSLNGRIVAQTSQGQIVNKWFVALPKTLNLQRKKNTILGTANDKITIDCAAANIAIQNGIIKGNNQVALETNALDLTAGGTVNFFDKTMDVNLYPSVPDADKTNEVLSLTKMIRIAGPFNKLTPKVDTQKAATSLIEAGIKKLAGDKMPQTSTAPVKGALCQNVLGTYAQSKQANTPTTTKTTTKTQPTKTTTVPQNAPQQFKDQLLNSLFQALTPQQQ